MSQLQPEFDQLGIHDVATSNKKVYVYGGMQLPDKIQYLPIEHKLALERFKAVPNHTVCIVGNYVSTQKGKFRTQKVRSQIIGKTGRVVRDARGWCFSRLCNDMPMSAVEHIFTQIIGRNLEQYDRSTSSDPDRQKLKLINSMIQYIWPLITNMHHVLGRGDVYCWHVMLNRACGRSIGNADLLVEDAHLHMQSKLAAMLKLSEKLKFGPTKNGMDADLFVEYVQAELTAIEAVYLSTGSVRAAGIWAQYSKERGYYSAIVDVNTHWNDSDERASYFRWPRQYARCSQEQGYVMPLVYLQSCAQEKVIKVPTSSLSSKPTVLPYWRASGRHYAGIERVSPENIMDECLKSSTDSNDSEDESHDGVGWRSSEQPDPKLYVDTSSTDSNSTDNALA